ncbi:MAG: hypothetical protein ACTSVI_03285, partial [Promethearchaeota archaeon]
MLIKRKGKLLMVIISSLFVSLMIGMMAFLNNDDVNTSQGLFQEIAALDDGLLKSDITSQNNYTGVGQALALNEWADSTNTTEGLSFIDAQTVQTDVRLAESWTGYSLYTYVYDLFETDSWVSAYSFPSDGNENDHVNNGVWNYGEDPADTSREIGGEIGTSPEYVWVDLNSNARNRFYAGDRAWWQQSVNIPRGEIVEAWVAFDYWTGNWGGYARCPYADFNVYIEVNGQKIFNIPSPDMGAAGSWSSTGLHQIPASVIQGFPATPGAINVRVGAYCASAWSGASWNMYARFDNVRFFVKARARPTDVNLRMTVDNDTAGPHSIQNINYGSGSLQISPVPSNWTAGPSPVDIFSTFTTNSTTDFPADGLEIVEFNVQQTIYGTYAKDTTTEASLLSSAGSTFTVGNNSDVYWTTYFYDRPPQVPLHQEDYVHYKFNGTKPSDWDIYSIIDSQPVEKISYLIGAGAGNTTIEMPESQAAYYGFWSISVTSPNYVTSISVNDTDIYEGDTLRFSGSILGSPLINTYIDQTNALLTIKYPNGTVWLTQQVAVNPDTSVIFSPVTIPSSGSDYIAGTFTAILSWNNSYSGNPINETGVKTLEFIVKHRSQLIAEKSIIYDILDSETALPIQLRYVDLGDNQIENANITFTNFDGQLQNFSYTAGYYNYLTLLNCSNGSPGLNQLNITATSPSFETKTIIVQVEIVKLTNFTIAEFPSVSVEWNGNFTLTLNYTERNSGAPIQILSPNNITVTWPQATYSVDMSQAANGIYTLEFNTSGTSPDTSYTVPIKIKEISYQGKTIVMDISVTPKLSTLSIDPIPTLPFGELMSTTATYKDAATQGGLVNSSGNVIATARIIETSTPCTITEIGSGQYNITLDSWLLLNTGVYTLEVNFSWSGQPYYANWSSTTVFDVGQRSTNAYASGTYDIQSWDTNFTILISYLDVLNGSSINDSSVNIQIDAYDGGSSLTPVNTQTSIYYDDNSSAWALEFYANHFGRTNIDPGFTVNVYINWTSNVAPYYINQSISFVIKIDEAPTFLYIEDPSTQTAPSGAVHNVTFVWINQRTGQGINQSSVYINVTRAGSLVNPPVFNHSAIQDLGDGKYLLQFNITSLAGSYISFNISINRTNFQNIENYSFTLIKIAQVPVVEIINIDRVHLDQEMNFTLFYHLQGSSSGIPNAVVNVSNGPTSGVWAYSTDYNYSFNGTYYNITFTPSFVHSHVNSEGSYAVFVNFSSAEGDVQLRVNFNVDPLPTNFSKIFFDSSDYTSALPSYTTYIGDMVTVEIYLEDTYNHVAIPNATVTINLGAWSGPMTWNAVTSNYSVTLNTSQFGTGPSVFTVVAQKANYTQTSKQVKLDILSVSTDLIVYLNGTLTSSMQLYYGQNITVSAIYNDTHNNINISDSSVTLTLTGGSSSITTWSLSGDFWISQINTTDIGTPGTYSMTLSAGLTNYQTAIATFVISILQIPTELNAYNETGSLQSSYSVYWGQSFNVSLLYKETIG